ncbi:hypothetical protein HYU22_02180 [Candidatus Woesearchaeota archaeon]|nr:hypothetical protein [Candidatus Woesearchaeota archaeon]
MAQETHYLGSAMVVVLDQSPHDELLEKYRLTKLSSRTSPELYYNLIRQLLPDCFTDKITPIPSHYFQKVTYTVPLTHGHVDAVVEFTDNLEEKVQSCFNSNGTHPYSNQLDTYKRQFQGKSAAIIRGTYSSLPPVEFYYPADEVVTAVIANAFCRQERIGQTVRQNHHGPLQIVSTEVKAKMKDLTLQKLRQADEPLHEFFRWVQQEMPALNTLRELLILARSQEQAAHRFERLLEERQVISGAAIAAHNVVGLYLSTMNEIVAAMDLTPPQNNRMEYLVAG